VHAQEGCRVQVLLQTRQRHPVQHAPLRQSQLYIIARRLDPQHFGNLHALDAPDRAHIQLLQV